MFGDKEIGLIFKAISHILYNQEKILKLVDNDEQDYLVESTNELSVLYGKLSEQYYNKRR